MFTYLDAMIADLPIVDSEYRAKITPVEDVKDRLERVMICVEYLDKQWACMPNQDCSLDWPVISEAIIQDVKDIQQRPKREQKHHY